MRVVDGDTVDVQLADGRTERLRLIGIDSPEVVDPRKPVQCFGRETSAHAHELLDGQTVTIELDASQGARDIYGRLLAYVWVPDGRNFGEVMIADGFAHEYTYNLPYAYLDSFSAAQGTAIANQLGLWSPSTCAVDTSQPADTVTAAPEPEAPAPAPRPSGHAPYAGPYDPFGQDRNCGEFKTHADAQAFFIAAGGPGYDPHQLDGDHDGIACETLPGGAAGDTTQPADSVAEAPAGPATYAGPYDPFGQDRNCGEFKTHADAQAFFIAAGGPNSDRHGLDGDTDGIACEALP